MTILEDGKVGIGTTLPQASLHVEGDIVGETGVSSLGQDSRRWGSILLSSDQHIDYGGSLTFSYVGTPYVTFDASGNVGIGTTVPLSEFDVNGQMMIRGGDPGANKYLASNSVGLGTWVTLDTDAVLNASNITGYATLTDALDSIKIINDAQTGAISSQGSAIGDLQNDVGTVTGDDLQTQISTEAGRNDTQDSDISTLQGQMNVFAPSGAVKGDALIYDTADSKWHPDSLLTFRSGIQIDTKNDGMAASWLGAPYAKWQFTGITITLYGRYADPNDPYVPQGNTLFQEYVIPPGSIEEWQVTAHYNGWNWNIRGSFAVILPSTISNGYGGYTTNLYQALLVQFTGASQNLWYGRLSYSQYEGVGRTMAPYKRFANTTDNVRYAGDASGYYICTPRTNGIFLGDNDHWFYEFTRANARTMPGIFTPGRKYAISFDVQAPSYNNVIV